MWLNRGAGAGPAAACGPGTVPDAVSLQEAIVYLRTVDVDEA